MNPSVKFPPYISAERRQAAEYMNLLSKEWGHPIKFSIGEFLGKSAGNYATVRAICLGLEYPDDQIRYHLRDLGKSGLLEVHDSGNVRKTAYSLLPLTKTLFRNKDFREIFERYSESFGASPERTLMGLVLYESTPGEETIRYSKRALKGGLTSKDLSEKTSLPRSTILGDLKKLRDMEMLISMEFPETDFYKNYLSPIGEDTLKGGFEISKRLNPTRKSFICTQKSKIPCE